MSRSLVITLFSTLVLTLFGCSIDGDPHFSKSYWKKFDWSNFENSSFWTDPDLKENSSFKTSDSEDGRRSKQKEGLLVGEIQFDTWSLLDKKGEKSELNLAIKDATRKSCENIVEKLDKSFGPHGISVNNSYKINSLDAYDERWQWDLDNTQVTMLCTDFKGSDRTYLSINYQMKSDGNKLQKPIDLSCDVTFISEDYSMKKGYGMGISIFPNARRVVNSESKEGVAKINKLSDETIDVTQNDKNTEFNYIIDRKTGKLVGGMFVNSQRVGLVGGQCQAVDLSAKKF